MTDDAEATTKAPQRLSFGPTRVAGRYVSGSAITEPGASPPRVTLMESAAALASAVATRSSARADGQTWDFSLGLPASIYDGVLHELKVRGATADEHEVEAFVGMFVGDPRILAIGAQSADRKFLKSVASRLVAEAPGSDWASALNRLRALADALQMLFDRSAPVLERLHGPGMRRGAAAPPTLSVVVVVHNMSREAPRTLYSLSAAYQKNIDPADYEVIVIDNGSDPAFDAGQLSSLQGRFRLLRLDPAPPSPAFAANLGITAALGNVIGVMIDGARMVTPGFLHFGLQGAKLYPRAVTATLGWYLGRDQQCWAAEVGYNKDREDALLDSIGWPTDGYRLFEIGAMDESTADGWFAPISESNGLFMNREMWGLLGGFDERFDLPGGGLVNLDVFNRALELPGAELVIPLGEATFHQLHGGIATNADAKSILGFFADWARQYEAIRSKPWKIRTGLRRTYLGTLPPAALAHLARAAIDPISVSPLTPGFDRELWMARPPRPGEPTSAALVDLAEAELRSRRFEAAAIVARIARGITPDEPAPQHFAAVAGPWLRSDSVPPASRSAPFHLARGKALRLIGDDVAAGAQFQAALAARPDFPEAHLELAKIALRGEDYLWWLRALHARIRPSIYLEIGVFDGQSLAAAAPPTRSFGVDPTPMINVSFTAETHIYCQKSDAFFERENLRSLFGGSVSMAFIDGLHVFDQVLRDFMNTEAQCEPGSLILIHDTLPLDEVTQRPAQERGFYTGDVWKIVPCLKRFRPDLLIQTVRTPPSGLTLIAGLKSGSRVLKEHYDGAIQTFGTMPYEELDADRENMLNLAPNDWLPVEQFLIDSGIVHTPIIGPTHESAPAHVPV